MSHKPKRVIFLNRYFHPDTSATSQLLTDLAVHLAQRGREVHVIASRQLYEDASARLDARSQHEGVQVHRVWTTRFGRQWLPGRAIDYLTFYLMAAARLHQLARAGDVVVAKTDPPLISAIAAWVARRRGAILVNWLQDVFPDVAQRLGVRALAGPLGSLATGLRNYSLRRAAANVVLGERMAEHIAPFSPLPPRVIENWADGSEIRPVAPADNPLRGEWQLEGHFVVGYSGNMGRAHEFQTILEACTQLREEDKVTFLFIGSGGQRSWMEGEVARRGLRNVLFKPYQPRSALAHSLSVIDVHLVSLNPRLEGLIVPSKLYGIAAAGRPTVFIGDPEGHAGRQLRALGSGSAVASGDSGALVETLRDLHRNPATRSRMGENARESFLRNHDRRLALARWEALLDEIG